MVPHREECRKRPESLFFEISTGDLLWRLAASQAMQLSQLHARCEVKQRGQFIRPHCNSSSSSSSNDASTEKVNGTDCKAKTAASAGKTENKDSCFCTLLSGRNNQGNTLTAGNVVTPRRRHAVGMHQWWTCRTTLRVLHDCNK